MPPCAIKNITRSNIFTWDRSRAFGLSYERMFETLSRFVFRTGFSNTSDIWLLPTRYWLLPVLDLRFTYIFKTRKIFRVHVWNRNISVSLLRFLSSYYLHCISVLKVDLYVARVYASSQCFCTVLKWAIQSFLFNCITTNKGLNVLLLLPHWDVWVTWSDRRTPPQLGVGIGTGVGDGVRDMTTPQSLPNSEAGDVHF